MREENDTNGHLSQESNVTVDAENSNIDEPDIIHDSSKIIDANAEQTESMVDVEHNDVSQKELPVQFTHDSEGVNTVDKATDVNCDPSKDSDHTVDAENMTFDEPDHILDSVKSIQWVRQMTLMVILVKNLMFQLMWRIATLMSLILFMTVPKPMMQMLSRQNQWLMMMLNKMMYPKI